MHVRLYYLITSVFVTTSSAIEILDKIESLGCNYKISTSNRTADYVIGALIPVHYKDLSGKYQLTVYAISWVESILYAINDINNNKSLLPGVVLGYDIRESCDSQLDVIVKHTVDFMLDDEVDTKGKWTNETCDCDVKQNKKIIAVIGANTFAGTDLMSHLLTPYKIPLISYSATSPLLSDKEKYPTFARTVPSATYETKVIIDIFKYFNWSYISALASDDDAGRETLDQLEDEMSKQNMCIAVRDLFDPSFPGRDLDKIVEKLKSVYNKTRVIVLWCKKSVGWKLITYANDHGLTEITWVTTWGRDKMMTQSRKSIGIIDIQIKEEKVPNFESYLDTIMWNSPLVNPWFPLFGKAIGLQEFFGVPLGRIIADIKHFYVMQAPYAIAHALHKLFKCNDKTCPDKNKPINKTEFIELIHNVKFIIPNTDIVNQLKDSSSGVSYKIFMYEPLLEPVQDKNDLTNHTFTYTNRKQIGSWKAGKIILDKEPENITWRGLVTPRALCSEACPIGKHKPISSSKCCWECIDCIDDHISVQINQQQCIKCAQTQISNSNHTKCVDLTNRSLSFTDTPVQILIAIDMIGVLLVCFVIIVYVRCWNTPVIKSSSREITLIQLISMILLFLLPFFFIMEPSREVCIMEMVSFSTFYSQIVAFIVLKTYRLFVVFKDIRFTKVSKYLHSKYQIFFGFLIVFIQLLALMIWFLIYPVKVAIYKNRKEKEFSYYCENDSAAIITSDTLLYVEICYIFILSLSSGFMAFRARKLPQNFNEAQFIWFAMFTSCLAWLLFIPVYESTLERYNKPLAFLIITSISTFCLLFILNGYKIAIILFYPHLNSKEHFQKIAANATVTTFLKEVEPTNSNPNPRSREVSVISFDFDGMFTEYKMQQTSATLPTRKSHFPSMRKALSRLNSKKQKNSVQKMMKARTKTLANGEIIDISKHPPLTNRSISLDEIKLRKEQFYSPDFLKDHQVNRNQQKRKRPSEHFNMVTHTIEEEDENEYRKLSNNIESANNENITSMRSMFNNNKVNNKKTNKNKKQDKRKKSSTNSINLEKIMKSSETYL